MNLDLGDALHDIADDAGRTADLGPVDRIVARRRRRRLVRRGAGTALGLVLVGGVAIAGRSLAAWRDVDPLPAASPTPAPTSPGPTPDPTPTSGPTTPVVPETPATEQPVVPPPVSLPLVDPYESRWQGAGEGRADIVSATPRSATTLDDGDYFGFLHAVDAAAGTVTADIAVFYGGASARTWTEQNEPEALIEGDVLNGYRIVNAVVRDRVLTLAPDAVVTGYCLPGGGSVVQRDRTLDELAADGDSSPECLAQSAVGQFEKYWFDVRDGLVVQVVGQYVP